MASTSWELPSYTLYNTGCSWWAYHLGLSPIKDGSNTSATKVEGLSNTFSVKNTEQLNSTSMSLTVMNPLKGEVGGVESPLSIKLHCLCVREFICKARAPRPRREKRLRLESHHWSGEEAQGTSVHLEPLENVGGVEEPYHGHPAGENQFSLIFLDFTSRQSVTGKRHWGLTWWRHPLNQRHCRKSEGWTLWRTVRLCLGPVGAEASPDPPGTSPGSEWAGCSNSYWPRPTTSSGDTSYKHSSGFINKTKHSAAMDHPHVWHQHLLYN